MHANRILKTLWSVHIFANTDSQRSYYQCKSVSASLATNRTKVYCCNLQLLLSGRHMHTSLFKNIHFQQQLHLETSQNCINSSITTSSLASSYTVQ